ncbi:MAG: LptF/LptG family permease [Kiritimatiellia bacterium]|nr:LptF/LptG family permease [Lentisphaerota bacterium]
MKLLDRHILRQVIVPVFFCILAFTMVFVLFDLFDNLAGFIAERTSKLAIARYYLFVLPALAVYITPISLLLGLLYGLWQMTRHNELTAMRASGVSLLRIALPLLTLGLLASVSVSLLQELVAPDSSYWAAQFVARQRGDEDLSLRFAYDLPYKNERGHRIWAIRRLDLYTHELQGVKLIQQRPDGSDFETIRAEKASYLDGRWWFFDVMIQKHDFYNNPMGAVENVSLREMRDLNETPRDFVNVVKDPMFLSSAELRSYLRRNPNLSVKTQARYLVDLHARLAMPWTCLVVVLFGIPFGIHTVRRGAFLGVMLALMTFFMFYILMMISQWMGKEQVVAPQLGAWLPNGLFLLLGLILMRRVR